MFAACLTLPYDNELNVLFCLAPDTKNLNTLKQTAQKYKHDIQDGYVSTSTMLIWQIPQIQTGSTGETRWVWLKLALLWVRGWTLSSEPFAASFLWTRFPSVSGGQSGQMLELKQLYFQPIPDVWPTLAPKAEPEHYKLIPHAVTACLVSLASFGDVHVF